MTTTIPQRDLRNHNAKIIDRVQAGESFVVTRDGVPIADIVPHVAQAGPPAFPETASLVGFLRPGAVDVATWLADIRLGDHAVDDDPIDAADPWERGRA